MAEYSGVNHHPHQLAGDIGAVQGQVTRGAIAERGPTHPDERSASTGREGWDSGLLDHIDEETRMGSPHRPLTSNDMHDMYP